MVRSLPLSENFKSAGPIRGLTRGHDATLAGADMFRVHRRKTGEVPHSADGLAAVASAPSRGAVFDQNQAMLVGERFEGGGEIAGRAGEVNGDDRFGPGGDGARDGFQVEIESGGAEIGEAGRPGWKSTPVLEPRSVLGVVMTSSPGPMPAAAMAMGSAAAAARARDDVFARVKLLEAFDEESGSFVEPLPAQ